jgi:hypothetical protein
MIQSPDGILVFSTNPHLCSGLGARSDGPPRPWNGYCYKRFSYLTNLRNGLETGSRHS